MIHLLQAETRRNSSVVKQVTSILSLLHSVQCQLGRGSFIFEERSQEIWQEITDLRGAGCRRDTHHHQGHEEGRAEVGKKDK